jgi:hypothetical protein
LTVSPKARPIKHGSEPPSPWADYAPQLAQWALERYFIRDDVWGGYNSLADRERVIERPDGSTCKLGPTWTRPRVKDRGKVKLTQAVVERHYRATRPEHVIGAHTTSPDNLSKFGTVEVDVHGEESNDPSVTWKAVIAWYDELRGRGSRPLLWDSNGRGGYHLDVFLAQPIPTPRLFAFLKALTADYERYGLPAPPETFPKQQRLALKPDGSGAYGNWSRLPGLHHTRPHWARIWNDREWLTGDSAAEFMLSLPGDDPALVPVEPDSDRQRLERRIRAYAAKLPTGLAEGQGRDDVAYQFAAFLVRDLNLSNDDTLPWLLEWDRTQAVPKGETRLREIIAHVHSYGNRPYGCGLNGDGHSLGMPARPPAVASKPAADPPDFSFIDSATFIGRDCRVEWAIPRLFALNQPCVLGGPQKTLKTSALIEFAVGMGAPASVFGYFPPSVRQLRVGIVSGESGEAALQSTFRRITVARHVDPAACSIFWGFRLPSLADPAQLDALVNRVQEARLDVIMIDPLYLSLMAGLKGADFDAKNLYDVGPLLAEFSQRMLACKCTPVLAHHFKQTRQDQFAEPDLGDLSYAGIREYARQWILLGRRQKYEHDGRHRLHLVAGGSIGHSYAYAVDVNEGTMAEDFSGRVWETEVMPAGDMRRHEKELREQSKGRERDERKQFDDTAVMAALDKLDPGMAGVGIERVRASTDLSRDRMTNAVERLIAEGTIRRTVVRAEIGSGASKPAKGIVRVE